MKEEYKIYYTLEQVLDDNVQVPEEFIKKCIKRICCENGIPEEYIKEIIDEYENTKKSGHLASYFLFKKISNIAMANNLNIGNYDDYRRDKSKKAREFLVGSKTEEDILKSDSKKLDDIEWLIEQYEKIGEKPPSNLLTKLQRRVDTQSRETNNVTVLQTQKETSNTESIPKEDTISKKVLSEKTEKSTENSNRTIASSISLEEFNAPEARDKLIIKMILEGKTLHHILYKGIQLSKIGEMDVGPEIKAYVNLLKGRVREIADSINQDYIINYTRIRGNDLKQVLEWILGEKMGGLQAKKNLLEITLNKCKSNRRLDTIRNTIFRDGETREYNHCSMFFVIENLRNEKYIDIGRNEEKDEYKQMQNKMSQVVEYIIKSVNKGVKSNQISE